MLSQPSCRCSSSRMNKSWPTRSAKPCRAKGILWNAATFKQGLSAARRGDATVLIVDRMLAGEVGLKLVGKLRDEGNPAPVLVISALSTVERPHPWPQGGATTISSNPSR